MSYIGSTPTTQSFIAGTDYFNGTGAQINFTLSRSVNSVNDIEVIVNNVEQIPSGYSVSGTTLTFSAAPSAGTSNVYVRYLSTTNLSLAIPAGTSASFNTVGVTGSLNFTGTGNRITGDFSNGTFPNRVMFQTSTTNGNTVVQALPNGTGFAAGFRVFNSSDSANSSTGEMILTSTAFNINAGNIGTGAYQPMTFSTGGSERVRVDTSGNVGIGMTPTNFGNGYTVLQVANASNGGMLYLTNTANAGGRIYGNGAGLTYDAFSATYHAFNTNGSERARIDSSGNLLVGRTTNASTAARAAFDGGVSFNAISCVRAGTGFQTQIEFFNPNGGVGYIYTSGSSTFYITSSDYRLKENIQPMLGALAKVALLKPVTYKWKVDGSDGQGFIAHELQVVVPECVSGERDAMEEDGVTPKYQGIDTSFLVATLTAAIQEQQTLITALTARITALESK